MDSLLNPHLIIWIFVCCGRRAIKREVEHVNIHLFSLHFYYLQVIRDSFCLSTRDRDFSSIKDFFFLHVAALYRPKPFHTVSRLFYNISFSFEFFYLQLVAAGKNAVVHFPSLMLHFISSSVCILSLRYNSNATKWQKGINSPVLQKWFLRLPSYWLLSSFHTCCCCSCWCSQMFSQCLVHFRLIPHRITIRMS